MRGIGLVALVLVGCGGSVAETDTRGTTDQRDAGPLPHEVPESTDGGICQHYPLPNPEGPCSDTAPPGFGSEPGVAWTSTYVLDSGAARVAAERIDFGVVASYIACHPAVASPRVPQDGTHVDVNDSMSVLYYTTYFRSSERQLRDCVHCFGNLVVDVARCLGREP